MDNGTTINQLYQSLQDLKYYIDTQPAPGLLLRGQLVKELPGYKKPKTYYWLSKQFTLKNKKLTSQMK